MPLPRSETVIINLDGTTVMVTSGENASYEFLTNSFKANNVEGIF